MSNWGRIATDFWRHDKATPCSDAAIGVWTRANSWSRDHRTAGFISYEQAGQYDEDCVLELVTNGLWDRVDGGYLFHNYPKHNGDVGSRSAAARMVFDVLGGKYPEAVVTSLGRKVEELINEGQDPAALKDVVKVWGNTPGAGVALLPFLLVDVIRKRKDNDLLQVIRECYRTNDVTPLRRFGYWFRPPTTPDHIKTTDEMRAYMREAQREWLTDLAGQLNERRTA